MKYKNSFLVITIIWAFLRVFISFSSYFIWSITEVVDGTKFFITLMLLDAIIGSLNVGICTIYLFFKHNILKPINSILFIGSCMTLIYIIYANFYSFLVYEKNGLVQGAFCSLILILQNYIFIKTINLKMKPIDK